MSDIDWLRYLPEAGTIARLADDADALLAEKLAAQQRIARIDLELTLLYSRAVRDANRGWSAAEIALAMESA